MTIEELKNGLQEIISHNGYDVEQDHYEADILLIEYINDDEVSKLFDSVPKWYS